MLKAQREAEFWMKELSHLNFVLHPKEKQSLRGLAVSQNRPVHAIMLEAIQAHLNIEHESARVTELEEALEDMLSGWRYLREHHGDLAGVGWDRAQAKAEKALEK